MHRIQTIGLLSWTLLLGACGLNSPPETTTGDPCVDPGETCLVLHVTALDSVRRDAPGDMRGDLHWGLYKDGDVGSTGPGDHPSVAGDFAADVDLSAPGSSVDVPIGNLEPRAYQVLGFLDDNASGESDEGDPVTLPSQGFDVVSGEKTTVDVVLNFIR